MKKNEAKSMATSTLSDQNSRKEAEPSWPFFFCDGDDSRQSCGGPTWYVGLKGDVSNGGRRGGKRGK